MSTGLSQDAFASASDGVFVRTTVVQIESGTNQATTARILGGIAKAVGGSLSGDDIAAFLDGKISLDEVKRRRDATPERATTRDDETDRAAMLAAAAARKGASDSAIRQVLTSRFLDGASLTDEDLVQKMVDATQAEKGKQVGVEIAEEDEDDLPPVAKKPIQTSTRRRAK